MKIYGNADFSEAILSLVLRDLIFRQNHPLKSTNEEGTGILKNKIKNLESRK